LFVESLKPHGVRFFLQEFSHAYSWIVEDYVLGRRDSFQHFLSLFDGDWLRNLRRINQTLPEDEWIAFRYFDMNHINDAGLLSLGIMNEEVEILPYVKDVLSTCPQSIEYENTISDLYILLTEEREKIRSHITLFWYDRLLEIMEIEKRSLPVRKRWNDHAREQIMIDLALRTIEENSNQEDPWLLLF